MTRRFRRFRLFTTGEISSETGSRTTLRLGVPPAERDWWRVVLEKILSVYPNCHAVSPRAPCQSEKGPPPPPLALPTPLALTR